MSEARNIIILILILLFIFVGVGVAISRFNKKQADSTTPPKKSVIELIFGDKKKITPTPKATPTPAKTVIVTDSAPEDDVYIFEGTTPMPTVKPMGVSTTGAATPVTPNTTKGGQPQNIPATGANPLVVLLALAGLTSGIYIHKKVEV